MMNFAKMMIPKYYVKWVDHMEDYLNNISEDIWRSIETRPYHVELVQVVGNVGGDEDMVTKGNKKKANDKRCICELQGPLSSVVYNYVRGYKMAKTAEENKRNFGGPMTLVLKITVKEIESDEEAKEAKEAK
ncbi:unnamed protein product [Lactuca saligna]|uniref:Uncharacterized protein n=1 Tax=Lactuca saligna TaxID=75948 RepID=A0AA35Z2M3_LACSI|nr:unnamed protein product [Lactuca saligna]